MKKQINLRKYDVERYRSLKRGKNQKKHCHEENEILYFCEGSGTFQTAQYDYPFCEGMAIVVPAGLEHHSFSSEDFSIIAVPDRHQQFDVGESPLLLQDNEEQEGRMMVEILFRHRHESNPFMTELISSYIHFWIRRAELPGATETALNEVYRQLLENATNKELDLHALLTVGGYAEDYMRMLFKKRYGVPPLRFSRRLRMEQACILMENYRDLPLGEVAERCGYDDYVYFSKNFKNHTGQSPRQYLKSIQ